MKCETTVGTDSTGKHYKVAYSTNAFSTDCHSLLEDSDSVEAGAGEMTSLWCDGEWL
jgi:hypothetical protein